MKIVEIVGILNLQIIPFALQHRIPFRLRQEWLLLHQASLVSQNVSLLSTES